MSLELTVPSLSHLLQRKRDMHFARGIFGQKDMDGNALSVRRVRYYWTKLFGRYRKKQCPELTSTCSALHKMIQNKNIKFPRVKVTSIEACLLNLTFFIKREPLKGLKKGALHMHQRKTQFHFKACPFFEKLGSFNAQI